MSLTIAAHVVGWHGWTGRPKDAQRDVSDGPMDVKTACGLDGGSSVSQDSLGTLVLGEAERALIARRSRVGLFRALASQAFTGMLVVLGAWGIAGKDAGLSALIGAAAYFVPNALFALRLLLGYLGPKRPGSLAFFWGEFLKLLTVAGVVILVAWRWGGWLDWLAFLLGLLGVMKGYVVLLALRRLP